MSFVQALGGAIGLALGHCWRIAIVTLCCIPVLISGGVARLKAVQLSSSNAKFVVSAGLTYVSVFGPVFVPVPRLCRLLCLCLVGVSSSAAASVSVPPSLCLRLCHPATTCAASVFFSPLSTCCVFCFSTGFPFRALFDRRARTLRRTASETSRRYWRWAPRGSLQQSTRTSSTSPSGRRSASPPSVRH